MNKYVKQAKDEGLNWQTILIEETETELKVIVKDAVLGRVPFFAVNRRVTKVVDDAVADLESSELKERARRSLLNFATLEYEKLKRELLYMDFALLTAAFVLTSKTATAREKRAAEKRVAERVPNASASYAGGGSASGAEGAPSGAQNGEYHAIAQPLGEWAETYKKRVDQAFQGLAAGTAKDDYSANVSLRNVAEMTVRYERNMADLEGLREAGENLVWISTHGNCSKRCEPWQGRLYSLDGSSGTIDGNRYIPLETATDVYYTTKSGKSYKNGIISGYNCRHKLIPYRKGNKPFEVSAETVKKEREINTTQRHMEREVRYAKEMALAYKGVNDDKSKEWRKKAIARNKQYKAYSVKNKVAYYPARVRIFEGETETDKRVQRSLTKNR